MSDELTSQSRGGVYYDFEDGRGAVHTDDLTKADRAKLGIASPEAPQPEPIEEDYNG